jgi:hypothetical protein
MRSTDAMGKRLQIAGILLIIGLMVEAICLLSAKPIAFIIFVGAGGLLIFGGVAVYLFSLISISVVPD